MASMPYSLGIDIGGTSVKTACVTGEGRILNRETADLEASDPSWPAVVRDCLHSIERQHGPAGHTGLAAPGIAAPDGSGIWWMQGRLAALEGLNWSEFLGGRQIPVLNDGQAALVGEAWLGAAAGVRNVVLFTLGTGVGGAAMVDGRLLRGHLGRAGHLGHISLNPDGGLDIVNTPGSLEDAIGNCTVQPRSNGRFVTTHDLVNAFAAKDPQAAEIWLRSLRAFAAGIVSIINVLDPEVVLIGGGIASAGESLLSPLRNELNRIEWRPYGRQVRLELAALGEYAGAIGAARNAMLTASAGSSS